MSRLCKKGFLSSYLDYTNNQESPELFHLWSAISILSNALNRKCFIDRGYYVCYPNQYIVLVSESARCKKTTAAEIAIKLYRKAEISSIITEKITSASLSRHLHDEQVKTGSSSCFVFSGELGTFLGADSYVSGLMLLITTLYGCPSEWEYRTKTQGVDNLKNVFINILGATVPSWLGSMPSDMVEGGFSSRTLFIVQNIPRAPQPFPRITEIAREIEGRLINDLKEISKIEGEFKLTQEAEAFFAEWYVREYKEIDNKDPRVKAYYSRKGEHVMKLCMVLSASSGDDKVIRGFQVEQALIFFKQLEDTMPLAFRGVSFGASVKHMERIIHQIGEAGGSIEHSALLRKNSLYLDRDELKSIMETLNESNLIKIELNSSNSRKYYRLLEKRKK